VNETSATLLVAAACLFAVGLFALTHRRDAVGAVLALVLGFNAVACALVGFSGIAPQTAEAAQLQSFALVVEVTGALFAAAGVSMAALLRRRTGGPDLLELVTVGPRLAAGAEPGGEEPVAVPAEPAEEDAGTEDTTTDGAVDAGDED
jgi:NADH:ubiquinone oxidoreductase subunit K